MNPACAHHGVCVCNLFTACAGRPAGSASDSLSLFLLVFALQSINAGCISDSSECVSSIRQQVVPGDGDAGFTQCFEDYRRCNEYYSVQ